MASSIDWEIVEEGRELSMIKDLPNKYQQMFAEVPIKDNKKVMVARDAEQYYRVMDNILYIPPIEHMERNVKELMTLQEVFENYYNSEELISKDWDLKHINAHHYSRTKDILRLIRLLNRQEVVAVDIETTGFTLYNEEVLLIVFSWEHNSVATIDTFTNTTITALQQLFDNEDITFVWQNGKFDIVRLRSYFNIKARVDEDTMLMHYIGFNENRGTHGLGYLAMLYLGAPDWEADLNDIRKRETRARKIKQADFHYGMFPKEDLIHYAYFDGLATYRLYKHFKEHFPSERTFIYYKLIEASKYLAEVEFVGVYADQERIESLDKELTEEYNQLIKRIDEVTADKWNPEKYKEESGAKTAPEQFNPASPKQLKWFLGEFGHDVSSTDAEALNKLDSEFVDLILALRRNNKYRRTYVWGLRDEIDGDGRIHTTYNLHVTVTGRLSSSNPNMQNIPNDTSIKNIFKATPGYVLMQADYSQAELRVMAALSGDPWLKQVYIDGKDLHDEVAEEHWGSDFTEADRSKAKAVNFGIAYGRTANTLAPDLNMSFEAAEKLLKDWFRPMPYVKKYFDDKVTTALVGGYSETPFNRYRRFVVTPKNKNSVRNEAMNTTIQGTASDMTLFSLIEIQKELMERDLGRVVITVHDSIFVELKPEHVEEVEELVKRHMSIVPAYYLKTDVPFDVDIDVAKRWGEM